MPAFWVTYEGTRFPVRRGETLIGRSAYCTIVVSDVSVSREHASLRLLDGVLLLADLGSRNGTKVNGVALDGTRTVQIVDTILVGSAVLRIDAGEDAPISRRQTGNLLEAPGDPTTQSTTTIVELAYRLVGQAEGMDNPQKAAALIRDVVDSIVDSMATGGFKLHEGDGPKLTRIIAFVVQASADPTVAAWQVDVSRKLGIAP